MTHPVYGERYICFSCSAKFYDMRKEEPLCPKCGIDQRRAPKRKAPKPAKTAPPKPYEPEEKEIDDTDTPPPAGDVMANLELEATSDTSFDSDDVEQEEY